MVTVDLAGKTVLSDAFPDCEVALYYYGNPDRLPYPSDWLPFTYRDVWADREAYLAADCRIVWGDFTHSASLWQPARDSWDEHEGAPTRDDVAGLSFLFGREADLLKRTVSFGGTIITNTGLSYRDELYRNAFTHFYSGARRVLMRDAISAASLAALRPDERTLGIDCAFLNGGESLAMLSGYSQVSRERRLGVFFGRTRGLNRLLAFARELASVSGLQSKWLPWFHTRRRDRLLAKAFGLEPAVMQPSPGEILAQLGSCELIVTDTYHLAINAWRMGIPAICVGAGSSLALNSLSDKKKEVLYKMYGADDLHVYAEALKGRGDRRRMARAVWKQVQGGELVPRVVEEIERHRRIARTALLEAVGGALADVG